MAEPTLTAIFGAGATQNATTITIAKADLSAIGLSASASNTAESLLAAIVLKAKEALTDANFGLNIDQSITVVSGFDSLVQRPLSDGTFTTYIQNQFNVNLHKQNNSVIDPDDY